MTKNYMYILRCSDDSYYTGSTKDLEKRLQQHKNGEGANHTKKHLPVKLVYFEVYSRIDEAFYREKQIQGWNRKKKEALINGMPEKLHELAKCMNDTHYSGFGSAQPPTESVQSCFGSAQPPTESVQSCFGSAQPPTESAQSCFGSAQPPTESVQPCFGSAQPPTESVQPCFGSAQPPTDTERSRTDTERSRTDTERSRTDTERSRSGSNQNNLKTPF